jgi:hypothetical protein
MYPPKGSVYFFYRNKTESKKAPTKKAHKAIGLLFKYLFEFDFTKQAIIKYFHCFCLNTKAAFNWVFKKRFLKTPLKSRQSGTVL